MKKIMPLVYIFSVICFLFFVVNIQYFIGNLPTVAVTDDKFIQAIKVVLEHEGGYSNDKSDPGGATNYGVSLRFLRAKGIDVDGDGDSDEDDIKAMTRDGAVKIFKSHWWDKFEYNRFSTLHIATKVFDLSVNMGHIPAHKILQRAINSISLENLIVDGWCGDKTFAAANRVSSIALHKAIREEAREYYLEIIERNPKLEKFKSGWMKRAAW